MHLNLQRLESLHLLAQRGDLVLQAHGLGLGQLAIMSVGGLQG